ncbi:hypothetical protein LF817_06410 [Halobacillus sp. A1]|uniref:hypothetical protein n=1 Tax=Halobacillus sp. A1 TaxID=2880262 RepID=UPI0020A67634|nr:hypothetical protein [Halobacillus sp. A1]MCP3030973.1 hypothetical protein [Halobacillus sp. A1]
MVEIMILRAEKEVGMGCCGGICGEGLVEMKDEFSHHDEDRLKLGELYQELKEKHGDKVNISFLDPRNIIAIGFYFLKQTKQKNISILEGMNNFIFQMKYNAVFINGKHSEHEQDYDTLIEGML